MVQYGLYKDQRGEILNDKESKIAKIVTIFIICWLVWSCLFLIAGIGILIRLSIGITPRLFQRSFSTVWEIIICLLLLPIGGLEFSIFAYRQLKNNDKHHEENIPQKYLSWAKFIAIANQRTFFLLFGLILYGVMFAIGIIEVCVRIDSLMTMVWGVAMVYSLGVIIFTAMPYIFIKLNETEEKRKALRQKREDEYRQLVCEQLLSTAGMRFFVKYYDCLMTWNVSDILDIIEEEYTEQDKRQRVSASQKIFKSNLEQTALSIIANSSKIDEITKNTAKNLIE